MEKERTGITARSGDTHVIDGSLEHAEAVNIDAQARAEALAEVVAPVAGATVTDGNLADPPAELLLGDGTGEALEPIADDETKPRTSRGAK